jgi:lipoprotein-anchoring transpeptidase ErfK/SrfK
MRMDRRQLLKFALAWVLLFTGVSSAAPAQALNARSGGFWYIVQSGDTLSGISAKFDVSVAGIMQANQIKSPRLIYVGQKLYLPKEADSKPARDSASSGNAATAAAGEASAADDASVNKARGKVIYISLGKQRLWAYENGKLVYSYLVSTGLPERATKPGTFRVKSKLPEAWSNVWQLRMPFWMGIYDVGRIENGIHAMPMRRNGRLVRWALGSPGSFGCVVLDTKAASNLYKWAPLGTLVVIRR